MIVNIINYFTTIFFIICSGNDNSIIIIIVVLRTVQFRQNEVKSMRSNDDVSTVSD